MATKKEEGLVIKRVAVHFEREHYEKVKEKIKALFGVNGTLTQYVTYLVRQDVLEGREDEFNEK